jgi:predicted anti-sigma-YlaC factor YlaD
MRCDEARERFDELRFASAPAETVSRVREHLDRCPSCTDEFLWSLALVDELATLRSFQAPPVDVTDRVMLQVARERPRRAWPLAAAASLAFLAVVVPLGASAAPGWIVSTARGAVRVVSETADALPIALATRTALAGGLRSVLRAVLPDPSWIERARPFLVTTGHSIVAAILAASALLAGREWRAARKPSGARP